MNTKSLRFKVWTHIRKNALEKGIFVDFIGGYSDHCHCLVSLCADQTLSNIMKLIKGESSHWINSLALTREYFDWQDEYFVESVSKSNVDNVREYIKNQETHHLKTSFQDECDEMAKKFGFEKFNDFSKK